MTTINADEVRIPRSVRDAVSRHERVTVLNRERPVFAIVHPDDLAGAEPRPRGRSVREVAEALSGVPMPDPGFDEDMRAIIASAGSAPEDPWGQF